MDFELPDDDSRTEGAGRVHGAAGEVDLRSGCGSGCEGLRQAWAGTVPAALVQTWLQLWPLQHVAWARSMGLPPPPKA